MKKLLIAVALLLITGCGGPWIKTEGPFTSDTQNFSADLPQGWMRSRYGKDLMITRDGSSLQKIIIGHDDISKEAQQFNYTKKRVTSGMLPQEIAEVIIDNYQLNTEYPIGKVEENIPVTVAGKPGFMLQFVSSTKAGLQYRCRWYGLLSGNALYSITYTAPVRHYYDKDLAVFENIVRSFRLTKP